MLDAVTNLIKVEAVHRAFERRVSVNRVCDVANVVEVAQHVLVQVKSKLRRLHQRRVDDLLVRLIKRRLSFVRQKLLVFHRASLLPLGIPAFIVQKLTDRPEDVNAIVARIVHATSCLFLPLFRLELRLSYGSAHVKLHELDGRAHVLVGLDLNVLNYAFVLDDAFAAHLALKNIDQLLFYFVFRRLIQL